MNDRSDNNILYEAFGDIDPALAARSETGESFAGKRPARKNAGDKGRGRNLLPLIIIPVALIAAITAMVIISNNGKKVYGPADEGTDAIPGPEATETESNDKIGGRVYVWEKEGAGGDFTIVLLNDGTYSYYAGPVSSYIGMGKWTVEDGILTMKEISSGFMFRFSVKNDELVFISEGSNSFSYVNVEDGDRFLVKSRNVPDTVRPKKVLIIEAGDHTFTANFEDNSSAEELIEKLINEPVTVNMHDYGNFEKVGSLPWEITRNDTQITTKPGDVILYQGNQITIYYDENSWIFTKLAGIDNVTREELLEAFGDGDVNVRFYIGLQPEDYLNYIESLDTESLDTPSEGTLLYAIDTFMRAKGFANVDYPDSLDSLAQQYKLGGKTLKELGGLCKNSGESAGDLWQDQYYKGDGYILSVSHHEQSKIFNAGMTAIMNDLVLRSSVEIEGLELPFGIKYGDSVVDVLAKMGVALPPEGSFGSGTYAVEVDNAQDISDDGLTSSYSLKLVDNNYNVAADVAYPFEIEFVCSSARHEAIIRSMHFVFDGNSFIDSRLVDFMMKTSDFAVRYPGRVPGGE